MNKIYKVIWSKVKNCYVVVSEVAKRHSKSAVNSGFSVTRNILAGAVLLGLTAGVCAPVWAAIDVSHNEVNLTNNEKFVVRNEGSNKDLFIINSDGTLTLKELTDKELLKISNTGEVNFKNNQGHLLFHIGDANHIVYWGAPTSVTGEYATAWGQNTTASNKWSTAWGDTTLSSGLDSTAFGQNTRAEGSGSTSWGANTRAFQGDNTTAFGQWSIASGRDATAFGYSTVASGEFATAWGNGNWYNDQWDSTSRGLVASGQSSTAFGYATHATGLESTSFGHETDAFGQQSTAWGHTTHAIGNESTAFGEQTTVGGNHGTAFGYMTEVASGTDNAVAWGESTRASASHSTAFGYHTQAVAQGTLATGMNTIANGNYSASFGQNTRAIGAQSIAFGYGNVPAVYNTAKVKVGNNEFNTVVAYPTNVDIDPAAYRGVAKSDDSLAGMGGSTYAGSQYSLAYGADAKAKGNSALAFGENAKAGIDGSYEGAIALGKNTVSAKNGVALGNKSVVTTSNDDQNGYNYDKKTTSGNDGYIWKPTEGNVSVGNVSSSQSRRIQGVAAGYNDTDAVNVAQLKTVVGGAVAGVETEVQGGKNVTSVPKTNASDGHPIYTVHVDDLGYKVNNTAATPVAIKEGINFVNGKNTTAELKNGNVTFNANDTIINQGTGVTVTGGNLDSNTNSRTYTVNTKPMTFGGQDGGTFAADLGNTNEPVKVVGAGAVTTTTNAANKTITVAVNKDQLGLDPLTFTADDGSVERALGQELQIKGKSGSGITTSVDNAGLMEIDVAVGDFSAENKTEIKKIATDSVVVAPGTGIASVERTQNADQSVTTYTVNTKPMTFGGQDGGTFAADLGNANEPVKVVGTGAVTTTTDAANKTITVAVNMDGILGDESLKFGANAAEENGTNPVTNKLGSTVNIKAADADGEHTYSTRNLTTTIEQDETTGDTTILVKMDRELEDIDTIVVNGKDGKDGLTIKGADGAPGSIGMAGKDGEIKTITLNGKDGKDGTPGLNGETVTRLIVDEHEVATLDDGMNYSGDFGNKKENPVAVKLNKIVDVRGNAEDEADLTDKNIGVVAESIDDGENAKLTIKLKKDLDLKNEQGEIGSVTTGDTIINNNGLTINNAGPEGTTDKSIIINKGNVSFGDNYITNVQNAGDKVNNNYKDTTINNYAATISDVKNIAKWNAFVKKTQGEGEATEPAEAGTVDVTNPNFTFVEGENITIKPDATKNQITISAVAPEIAETSLKFAGDDGSDEAKVITKANGNRLDIVGGAALTKNDSEGNEVDALTDGNIGVVYDNTTAEAPGLHIKLAKDITGVDNITVNNTVTTNTLNTETINLGDTSITYEGDRINYTKKDGDTVTNYQVANTKDIVWNAFVQQKGETTTPEPVKAGTVDLTNPNFTFVEGENVTITPDATKNQITISAVAPEIAETSLKFAGDDAKADGTNVVTRTNEEKLNLLGGATKLTDNNIGVVNEGSADTLKIKLAKNIDLTNEGSVTIGDTVVNNDGLTINGGPTITKTEVNMGGNVIQNIGDAINDGDAVNYKQLKASRTKIEAGKNVSSVNEKEVDGHFSYTIDAYDTQVKAGNGLSVTGGDLDEDNVRTYTVGLSEENQDKIENALSALTTAADGKTAQTLNKDNTQANFISGDNITLTPSADGITIATKADVTFNTVNATTIEGDTITGDTINATTVNGDTINATTVNGDTVNTKTINLGDNTTIQEGDDNRITYKSGDTTYNVATLEDGMDFAGDDGKTIHKNLSEQLDIVGGAKDKASENNIYTYNDGDKLRINLAKDINGVDSVTVNNTINVGGKTTITGDTITTKTVNAETFKAGDTIVNNDGLTIKNGPSVTKNGVDAGGTKITNVAPGEDGTDAVNVDQLNAAINQVGGDAINHLGDQVNRLDSRMKKGLAGAAALSALHPMDFDPEDKLTFAAGVGNYRGENAAAVGAFYRPDEKVMFSVGGTMGNGENMVNAGISFSLDRVAHVTNSKTAMAREILDLRRELTELKASMASGNWMLDPSLTRLFPDTEENHWAYEYVKTLAGNHIIEGYPDGEFKGERMITRYEMAAILYRAMMSGVQLPDKALNEFAPELGRFRVDRVYGNGEDRHKVERIRVNDENRKERDAYGSKYEYFEKNPGANVSTGALPGTRQAEKAAKAEAAARQADKPSIVSEKAAS